MKPTFYITTPIYYVNDKPHIGHAYTTILADVLARFHRAAGEEVFFLTGLDEHGQKVQQAAEKRGVDPQTHCDEIAPRFLDLWQRLHIRNDDFIRTTEARHVAVVQKILQQVYDWGDIYEDEYVGLYSVSEERFITEKEAQSGEFRDIKELKEKNYFFRMSAYQQSLVAYIRDHPDFIRPEHRKNEILGFLKNPLGDLCISRPKSRLSWGIELPFDRDYVTYVWFDALINYITAPGYGSNETRFKKWWPANYHLIGKDILTTHAVYWPTMLMSAGLPLPKTIFAHGWWLSGESKMSKSLGNVVNPLELIDRFGVDPVRYYLMREMVLGQDASFTMESFVKRYNSDLANDFGNLLSRITRLMDKFFDNRVPAGPDESEAGQTVQKAAGELIHQIQILINAMRLDEALEEILQFIRSVNRYMEQKAPWKLVKEDSTAAGAVLYTAGEALRISALLLAPVMPNRTETVLNSFNARGTTLTWGALKSGSPLNPHPLLFPRIDLSETKRKPPQKTTAVADKKISYEDFQKVDLRTAIILEAIPVPDTDRLLKLKIRIGEEEREIVSGIAEHYIPEALVGKMIVVVANLEPATIRGVESRGMLLAANQGKALRLIVVEGTDVSSGARVF